MARGKQKLRALQTSKRSSTAETTATPATTAGTTPRRPVQSPAQSTGGGIAAGGMSVSERSRRTTDVQRSLGNSHVNRMIQRKCECGGEAGPDGECPACKERRMAVQRKSEDEAEELKPPKVPMTVQRAIDQGGGTALDGDTRASMESSFATDLSGVRIHTGSAAAGAARDLHAAAFTNGQDVYFGEGRYQPSTRDGRRLLAHEITHTIQQRGSTASTAASDLDVSHPDDAAEREADTIARRVTDGDRGGTAPSVQATAGIQRDALDELKKQAEEFAKGILADIGNRPGGPSTYSNPACPPNFCQPFADTQQASLDLVVARPLILAGISQKVNSRVVPLWQTYLNGGAAPANFTTTFGADFTDSPTTATTTTFLLDALRKDIEANHASLMGSAPTIVVDFTPRLGAALGEIDNSGGPNEMNFNVIGDIAGNIAGGIGKDQTSFPIGTRPSPFNDRRSATITAELTRVGSDILVTPSINFSIQDTIDLCPGNCGASTEQVATIPLSRFEATGLAGDVPFTIDFSAPAASLTPFVITPAAPPQGEVKASKLRIRSGPSTAAPILSHYDRGTIIPLECETTGTPVNGDPTWDQTDKGFVSNHYVRRFGSAPPTC